MNNSPPAKPKLFTPWHELRRFGLCRAFVSVWTGTCLVLSVLATLTVPWGQYHLLPILAQLHASLVGFTLVVFGFTILGGKDDFFEPVMRSQGREGLTSLLNMVLLLFWPLVLQGAALGLCVLRVLYHDAWRDQPWLLLSWRAVYAFVATWAGIQMLLSARYLFVLAITRLHWRYKETKGD